MGFNATDNSDGMAFDLRPYDEANGPIPEPTAKTVNTFWDDWRETLRANVEFLESLAPDLGVDAEGNKIEETNEQQIARERSQSEIIEQHNEQVRLRRCEILSAVCGGQPSAEQIAKLPYRPMKRFTDYIMRELSAEA